KAYDAAGYVDACAAVSVTVQNADTIAPSVTIGVPASSSTVSGTVTINASATDNVGVTRVEWYLDGVLAGSSSTASASFSWDSTTSLDGPHTFQAKAN